MIVILYDKKAETHIHIENVASFTLDTEAIGFSEKRFRYVYSIRLKNSVYGKSFPCAQYEIYKIIE